MLVEEAYKYAKEQYAKYGIDTEKAIEHLKNKAISIHCWQGDDVVGFDQENNAASGGILTTGNYPGRARNFEELKKDFDEAAKHIPGKKRINLHASYAVFDEAHPWVDRDSINYNHFKPWVEWAKERGYGIDFNPTLFSHPMVKEGLTVSSPDEGVRTFWIKHCIACREIAEQMGEALGDKVLVNFWIPDGLKDYPADRYGMRERLRLALDQIYATPYEHTIDSVEQKVFGIGVEGFTVGNQEFYVSYAAKHMTKLALVHNCETTQDQAGILVPLIDAGHFNPTENIADKLPSLLQFFPYVPLHVTRPMHWDSDHVVLLEDQIIDIAKEIARCPDGLDKVLVGLDFFDASINRLAAWTVGTRAMQKALLIALLEPHSELKQMQDEYKFSEKLAMSESLKTLPWSLVWDEYLRRENMISDTELWDEIKSYETDVLSKRN